MTVKAAMTLDGKIATARGESKWITSDAARTHAMRLRLGADAIIVGVNTILADDPSLTVRPTNQAPARSPGRPDVPTRPNRGTDARLKPLRRIVLDSSARTPFDARIVRDQSAGCTTIVVGDAAPARRVEALRRQVTVIRAPAYRGQVDVRWLLRRLGRDQVTHVLVEGGGEVAASFLERSVVQRVASFYAPMILGGATARKAVGGAGLKGWSSLVRLREVTWRTAGPDLWLTARVGSP